MYKVKFSNKESITFSSKDELLQYISEKWDIQKYQIVIKDNYISITSKLGNVCAIIGIIEQFLMVIVLHILLNLRYNEKIYS